MMNTYQLTRRQAFPASTRGTAETTVIIAESADEARTIFAMYTADGSWLDSERTRCVKQVRRGIVSVG